MTNGTAGETAHKPRQMFRFLDNRVGLTELDTEYIGVNSD